MERFLPLNRLDYASGNLFMRQPAALPLHDLKTELHLVITDVFSDRQPVSHTARVGAATENMEHVRSPS